MRLRDLFNHSAIKRGVGNPDLSDLLPGGSAPAPTALDINAPFVPVTPPGPGYFVQNGLLYLIGTVKVLAADLVNINNAPLFDVSAEFRPKQSLYDSVGGNNNFVAVMYVPEESYRSTLQNLYYETDGGSSGGLWVAALGQYGYTPTHDAFINLGSVYWVPEGV